MEQPFSKDLVITQSSNKVRKYSHSIPVHLLFDIFSRVPAKSVARFCCLSKFWSTTLVSSDFKELSATNASARPRLLFIIKVKGELLVFSSSQNHDNNLSLVATRHKYSLRDLATDTWPHLCDCGFFFLRNEEAKPHVICNPVTGESIIIPEVKKTTLKIYYCGYDPINKQFKVLCIRYGNPNRYQVLTLKCGKLLWRTIQGPIFYHDPEHAEICINGVLYYRVYSTETAIIVCFNVRSETFSVINKHENMIHTKKWSLFNYKGKLGARPNGYWGEKQLVLWFLKDAEKQKWSKIVCVLPPLGDKIVRTYKLVGMTSSGEILFSPSNLSNPFYLIYYNIKRNSITRVNVHGFEEFAHHTATISTFVGFVENMKLM